MTCENYMKRKDSFTGGESRSSLHAAWPLSHSHHKTKNLRQITRHTKPQTLAIWPPAQPVVPTPPPLLAQPPSQPLCPQALWL